jgi:hypothetical protein
MEESWKELGKNSLKMIIRALTSVSSFDPHKLSGKALGLLKYH